MTNSLPYDDEHNHANQVEAAETGDVCGAMCEHINCFETCQRLASHLTLPVDNSPHRHAGHDVRHEWYEWYEPQPMCGDPCPVGINCHKPCTITGPHETHGHHIEGTDFDRHGWSRKPVKEVAVRMESEKPMPGKVKVWNIVLAGFTYGSLTADDFAQIREALESVFDVHGSGVAPGGLILQTMLKNTAYPDTEDGHMIEVTVDKLRHEYPLLPNGMEIKAEKAAREHEVVDAAREYVAAKDAWNDANRPSAEIMKRRMKAMHALRNSLIRVDKE